MKKLVLPLSLVGMLTLGSTSVFANKFSNVNVMDKPSLYKVYKVNGTNLNEKNIAIILS